MRVKSWNKFIHKRMNWGRKELNYLFGENKTDLYFQLWELTKEVFVALGFEE